MLLLSRRRLYILAFFFFLFFNAQVVSTRLFNSEQLLDNCGGALIGSESRYPHKAAAWLGLDVLCPALWNLFSWNLKGMWQDESASFKKKKRWSERRMCSHTMSRIKVWWEWCATQKNHIVRLLSSLAVFTLQRHDVRPITLEIFKLPLPFSNRA